MILFVNKVKIKWEWDNYIEKKNKKNMNLNSQQIKWQIIKLKRKQFKKEEEIDSSLSELSHGWIL